MNAGARRLLIDGEYDQVSRASADVEALRRVHATPCTRDEARQIIALLCKRFNVPVTVLAFRGRNGRCSQRPKYAMVPRFYTTGEPVMSVRGRQKRKKAYLRDTEGCLVWELTISLPTMSGITTETGGWGLRAGIVLHEFAHAVIHARGVNMRAASHGPLFTWVLDGLVAEWTRTQQEIAA